MSTVKKLVAALLAVASAWSLLLSLRYALRALNPRLAYNNGSPSFFFIAALVAGLLSWLLFKSKGADEQAAFVSSKGLDLQEAPLGPLGGQFGSEEKRRVDFAQLRPSTISGRVREIRRYSDKSRISPDTLSFRLEYNRSLADYGVLQVRWRVKHFRKLRLEEGDDLEVALEWKRPWEQGLVASVRNVSSGQRSEPRLASNQVGIVEAIETPGSQGFK